MLAIQLNINALLLVGLVVSAAFLGFIFRSRQIVSLRRKVIELENEMLSNHSEILDLQRENASLEQQMKQMHIPVIAMKQVREDKSSDTHEISPKLPPRKDNLKNSGS
jgi:cell division protein FtsB